MIREWVRLGPVIRTLVHPLEQRHHQKLTNPALFAPGPFEGAVIKTGIGLVSMNAKILWLIDHLAHATTGSNHALFETQAGIIP